MIDFEKELLKFHFLDVDENTAMVGNEADTVIQTFNAVLKRIGKEQSKANTQLEELVELFDEEIEKSRNEEILQKQLEESDAEKLLMIRGFIEILDQIEDLYRYTTTNDCGSWSDQIKLLWDNISNNLLTVGVVKIDGLGTLFNPFLGTAKMIRTDLQMPEGMILEVLKSGYLFKSAIIRKAEVVVNKTYTPLESLIEVNNP